MTAPPPPPQFSPDRQWWWDGGQWLPASSAPAWAQPPVPAAGVQVAADRPSPVVADRPSPVAAAHAAPAESATTTAAVAPVPQQRWAETVVPAVRPDGSAWGVSALAGRAQPAVDTHLLDGERVVLRGSLHWFAAYWGALFFGVLGAVALLGALSSGEVGAVLAVLLLLGVPAGLLYVVGRFQADLTAFVVTDHRLLVKQGVVRRTSVELLLRQVESASVQQNLVSGLLGFGNLVVGGTGGTKEVLRGLAEPVAFRAALQQHVARVQESHRR